MPYFGAGLISVSSGRYREKDVHFGAASLGDLEAAARGSLLEASAIKDAGECSPHVSKGLSGSLDKD